MARNLLHKDDLAPFLLWLEDEGIPWKTGVGQWQVAQVKPRPERAIWEAVYTRLDMPEHLTVTRGLEHTVRRFIDYKRRDRRNSNVVVS